MIKYEYANITLNCLLLYLAGCDVCCISGANVRMRSPRGIELQSRMQSSTQRQKQQQKQMHTVVNSSSSSSSCNKEANNIENTTVNNNNNNNARHQQQHNDNKNNGGGVVALICADGGDYALGQLDEIDYSKHFVFCAEEIRCRYCHFIHRQNSRQHTRQTLRSHLHNYHRRLFNQIVDGSMGCSGGGTAATK